MRSVERIASRILIIRGQRVMIDADLADLYGVTTKRLNQQIGRNRKRFPADFVFRLTGAERAEVVANCDHLSKLRFSPNPPYAFTEHGALMASAVLNSSRAVEVSLYVVRAFVQLRAALATHREIGKRLDELERKFGAHDRAIGQILKAIRQLTQPPDSRARRRIGFV